MTKLSSVDRSRVKAWLVSIGLLLGAIVGATVTNGAADCVVDIDGLDASGFARPTEPLRVTDLQRPLPFSGAVPPGTTSVQVKLVFWPLAIPVSTPAVRGGGGWTASVSPADYQTGVGLYYVQATTDTGCSAGGWIRIEGDPLGSLAGRVAAIILGLGLLFQVAGVLRGSRWALIGALPTGAGIALLLQQSGALALDGTSWGIATGSAALIGGASRVLTHWRGRHQALSPRPRTTPRTRVGSPTETTRSIPDVTAPTEPTSAAARPSPDILSHAKPPSSAARESDGILSRPTAPAAPVAPSSRAPDPPRSAYGFIDSPDAVVAGDEFEVNVGLSAEPQRGVAGGEMTRPASSQGPYKLDIQITADGFALRAGESWRREVGVTADEPYPKFSVHLTAQVAHSIDWRAIQVKYAIAGVPIGFALRSVAVASSAAELATVVPKPQDSRASIEVPAGAQAADLTVTITVTDSTRGRLEWTFDAAPALGVQLPHAAAYCELGLGGAEFARGLMQGMNRREGKPGLYNYLAGVGQKIATKIPDEFWPLLASVAMQVKDRPVSVLLLCEEPYMPWDLAVLSAPHYTAALPDPAAPPFLAAQVTLGHWVFDRHSGPNARPKPVPPKPPVVKRFLVVSGDYSLQPGWRPLPEATAEAGTLAGTWQASAVNADTEAVITALEGAPDLIHFACHGEFDEHSTDNGLFLADGQPFAPESVMSISLSESPFVFLNACQVGQGALTLGDYAGMAQAFLFSGASGVIAPLWSIDDTIARGLAERFYARVFNGEAPAEVLREERMQFKNTVAGESGTWLAYQFFGHPLMRLERAT
ncbi:MAG TPA: CHAT domain-containing protein [Dermatophilaceae bacterium]|jgi:hypothetical protein|nr:hypothetical protein [Chloroflexota bacterium]